MTEENIAAGVEAIDFCVDAKEAVMSPALAVFRLVVDRASLYLHLADAQVSLEIVHIIHGIPKTKFHIRKKRNILVPGRIVFQFYVINLTGGVNGNKGKKFCRQIVFGGTEPAVAHPVTAFVGVCRGFGGHCSGIPDGSVVVNVIILSVGIKRNGIIAISGNAQQLCVLVEAVAAAGIGN